ncbi:MAG: PAS domain-containing sensor histidine kinase, partial [Zoogloea sp.]|nr:PAS domain-containing sensor histidine kinase [Zoogloea sp.]
MKADLASSFELQMADGLARAEPLRYLNLFRLVLAGFFLVAGRPLQLGGDSPTLFIAAAIAYMSAVLILGFRDAERLLGTPQLVTLQVLVDITLLTVIMWASGGYRSGIPILILVALAGAGLVGQGRMVLFYAAYATVAVLLENAFRLLSGRETVDFFTVGITCIGFFAIAQVARLLAQRALANEDLARQRGADLANQLRLNRQIIQDMQDGVLVVGEGAVVRQFNPQATTLLGTTLREGVSLKACAPSLERELHRQAEHRESAHSLLAEGSGKMLLVRVLP